MWNEKILLPIHNPRKNIFDNVDSTLYGMVCHILPRIVMGRTAPGTHFNPILNKLDAIAYLCETCFF